jgi:RimJ/RimL family protein N-acetyltransferase
VESVKLMFFEHEHIEELMVFQLPENQIKFSALPVDALKMCEEDAGRYPIVILNEGKAVGFFVLHKGEKIKDYTSNPSAMVVRALSINHSEQGRGFAKSAMMQLPQFVRQNFPEISELILSVNFKNETARQLYLKAGFQDRGEIKDGPVGPQHVLHYNV